MNLLQDPRGFQQAARRATTTMTILELGAWVGLIAGIVFWANFFFVLMEPQLITDMLQALTMAIGYSVVLPMLLSTLVPSTPAGMLLQQTRWRTIGFAASIAATGFMAYHALTVLWAYWQSLPKVAATDQGLFLAIGSLIIFVLVPALAWVQATPDRWVAEVIQAQQVRRLKAAQQANIMAAQVQYARAMALLKRGLANATAAERAELAGTLIAMQRAENEAVDQISDQMRILTGIDTGVRLIDDPQVEQQFHQLTGQVERLFAPINEADYVEEEPLAARRPRFPPASEPWDGAELPPPLPEHQDASPATLPPRRQTAEAEASAAARSDSRRLAAEFRAVAAAFPAPAIFGARQVAETVGKSDRTARDYLTVWLGEGWVARGEAPNSYYITRRA